VSVETGTDFHASSSKALLDPKLRANFRRAMDGLMAKRAAQFPDPAEWEALRSLAASIRARTLSKLPELLEALEARCTANGIRVHWAETTDDANAIVLGILRARGATRLVKGKSMVSEEMHLNDFLEKNGVESLESDLGEYIIQLDGETPSHIIMPAIHKSRQQIARQFAEKIKGAVYTEDVDALTATARRVLRRKFFEAEAGLSGVNIAVAETGTLVLVENEGNGRMSTHVPPVHIALMGLEKVVEKLEDVAPVLTVLTRSATGQPVSTYLNFITGPRGPHEKDGPGEVHLVILDNGRSRIYADPGMAATLRCIRCGACMNHCPVYTRVGGHAYEAVYPGPIGSILTPQTEGLAARHDLPHASSLCHACVEVCPVKIPITQILVTLRRDVAEGRGAEEEILRGKEKWLGRLEGVGWALWRKTHVSPSLYRATGRMLRLLAPLLRISPGPVAAWTRARTLPRRAPKTLHELAREKGLPDA
jgi:L-lactate dehydrogenase complex protein LldF